MKISSIFVAILENMNFNSEIREAYMEDGLKIWKENWLWQID